MNATSDLYARVLSFSIDEGTPDLSFETRLARENGWSLDFAHRVVFEYKRFVYLAVTVGHPVTPSDQVDQAWHLHLTYTRSYWERMCGAVLGRPLHHGPTRGGPTESARFDAQYEQTLASYRTAFGAEPPADVWPPAATRFGEDLRFVRVNVARNWVVPTAAVRRTAALGVVGAAATLCATGCVAAGDPFDLRGTDFLWFLIPLLFAALGVGLILRFGLRGPDAQPGDESDLDWTDAAYLAGREHRLAAAAIARLAAAGHLRVSADGNALEPLGLPANSLSPAEAAVYAALPVARDNRVALNGLARRVKQEFAPRAEELRRDGYLMAGWRAFLSGFASVLPLAAVAFVFGWPRLVHAIDTQQPREYLITTLVVTAVTCMGLFVTALNRLTRRGAHALRRLRSSTNRTASSSEPGAVAQQVAVFGTTALTACGAAELAALATWYPRPSSGTGYGGGCGTGCGAGGGCGGGGCGGGGCGGCGGCGG